MGARGGWAAGLLLTPSWVSDKRWSDLQPGTFHKQTSQLWAADLPLTCCPWKYHGLPPCHYSPPNPPPSSTILVLHCTLTGEVLTSIFCLIKAAWRGGGRGGAKKRSNEHGAAAHKDWPQGEKHNKTQDRLPVVRSSHTQWGAAADLSFSTQRGGIKGLFPQILFRCPDSGRRFVICIVVWTIRFYFLLPDLYSLRLKQWGFPFEL